MTMTDMPELTRSQQRRVKALLPHRPLLANGNVGKLIESEATLLALINAWQNPATASSYELATAWGLLAPREQLKLELHVNQSLLPEIQKALNELIQELAPQLLYYCLRHRHKTSKRLRPPRPIDDEGAERPKSLDEVPWHKYAAFYLFASMGSLFWIAEGTAGGYELFLYFAKLFGIASTGGPLGVIVAICFGLVAFSMISAVDLTFVAQSMGVPYLEAKQELKSLVREFELTSDLLDELLIKISDSRLSKKELDTCKKLFSCIEKKHASYQEQYSTIQECFERNKVQRRVMHMAWMIFAGFLYAGSANLTATTVLGLASAACPLSLGLTFGIAAVWMCVELYRFYNFEQNNIASATDALFGTPRYHYARAHQLSDEIAYKVEQVNLWEFLRKKTCKPKQMRPSFFSINYNKRHLPKRVRFSPIAPA